MRVGVVLDDLSGLPEAALVVQLLQTEQLTDAAQQHLSTGSVGRTVPKDLRDPGAILTDTAGLTYKQECEHSSNCIHTETK